MNLEDLYNEVKYGTRTFADKKLMRSLMPAMAGAISGRTQAGIAGNAGITRQGIASRGGIIQQGIDTKGKKDVAGMKEEGATHRVNLTNDAAILMKRLMESGLTDRLGSTQQQETYMASEKDRMDTGMLRTIRDLGLGGTGGGNLSNMEDVLDESLGPLTGRLDALEGKKKKKKKENDILPAYQLPY
jgi:hypothetical protein